MVRVRDAKLVLAAPGPKAWTGLWVVTVPPEIPMVTPPPLLPPMPIPAPLGLDVAAAMAVAVTMPPEMLMTTGLVPV